MRLASALVRFCNRTAPEAATYARSVDRTRLIMREGQKARLTFQHLAVAKKKGRRHSPPALPHHALEGILGQHVILAFRCAALALPEQLLLKLAMIPSDTMRL